MNYSGIPGNCYTLTQKHSDWSKHDMPLKFGESTAHMLGIHGRTSFNYILPQYANQLKQEQPPPF